MLVSRSFALAILAAMILAASRAGANDSLAAQPTPPDSAAASPGDSARAAVDHAFALDGTFSRLETGMHVRVLVPDARILEGPYLRTRDDLLLFDDAKDTVVPFEDIEAVWRQKRGVSEFGFVGGVGLGVASGIGLALLMGLAIDSNDYNDAAIAVSMLGGAIVGFGVGFGVGFTVGSLIVPGPYSWTQVYPAVPGLQSSWNRR